MLKLRDYQEEAVDFLYERDRAIVLAAVGAGKTAIALTLMREMLRDKLVKRWLVIAPKRVAKEVWHVEKEKWTPELTMTVAVGSSPQRTKAYASDVDIVVTNYDSLQKVTDLSMFDGVIFDELTRLKNPSGKRFKALYQLIAHINIRYGLTGSFTSNGLEDVFGQCKIVDWEVLGRTKTPFMQTYFICLNREFSQWIPKKNAFEQVMARIKPMAYLLENKEYKDQLPPLHTVEVKVALTDRKPYEKMKKDFVTEVDGEVITAVTAAAMTQKLQQLASGFSYVTEAGSSITPRAVWFSAHKFEMLDEIIEENQHAPTLVFYNFVEELAELKRRYPQLQTLDSPNAVQRFNEGKIELLAAHPKSAGHGLNLQGSAHHMVFLSLPWSFELYEQAVGRLHRGGQKHPVWVYVIKTEKTIDERIWAALHDKRALSEVAIEELRD